ncbi:zinc-binding protein [Salinisphaera sp. PC39]|uniref:DNA gyrase inhibitor YacG n=1 Tax=Salinisphaera sp. PC39 TaxID=1304156 RepID=UPI00334285EA
MARGQIPCPHCGEPASAGKDNPWRPFCCRRCKLIDLGEWLSEEHHIPGEPDPESGTGEPWDGPTESRH